MVAALCYLQLSLHTKSVVQPPNACETTEPCNPACQLACAAAVWLQVLMVVCYFGAQQVDVIIAKQQRRQLGLCEECGGLYSVDSCKQGNCPMKAKASR
jgi:hypothetical protein